MAQFKFDQQLVDFLSSGNFNFIWDAGNQTKNFLKHQVSCQEVEEVFLGSPLIPLGLQFLPEVNETRFGLLGKSLVEKKLFVCFTIREGRVRIISARPMSASERNFYEKVCQELARI